MTPIAVIIANAYVIIYSKIVETVTPITPATGTTEDPILKVSNIPPNIVSKKLLMIFRKFKKVPDKLSINVLPESSIIPVVMLETGNPVNGSGTTRIILFPIDINCLNKYTTILINASNTISMSAPINK